MWRFDASPSAPADRALRLTRDAPLVACAALAVFLFAGTPAAAVTLQFETPISGDVVPVTAELTALPHAEGVAIALAIPAGAGDLLGLFGNVADESLLPAMRVGDPDGIVSQWQIRANGVRKVGGGNTVMPVRGWDWGVMLGRTGSPGGVRVETAHFELRAPGLTVGEVLAAATQGWVLGVRIQSTSGPEGSSKLGLGADAPRLRIDVPEDGALLGATPAEVLGTVSGEGVSVDVNGVAANVSGLDFSADVPLAEGPNTLVATGRNAAGTATDRVEVTLDTTPPVVEIRVPADGTLTAAVEIVVEGTASDASPITAFTLNGAPVALTDGAFQTTVPLALGVNGIEAVALDAAGNEGRAQVSVMRGETPTVSVSSPSPGALLGSSPASVTGTVLGTAPVSVSVSGHPADVAGETFEASVPLEEGENALVVVAENAFGRAEDELHVDLDTMPPVVTIDAPTDGSELAESPVAVSGTVTDASPITALTLNGAALPPGTSSEAPLELEAGPNPIQVVATDAAGNSGEALISVAFGSEAPLTVSIEAPPEGAVVSTERIAVTGSVSDATASVRVEGVLATVTGSRFVASGVALTKEGENRLTATATRDGESATDVVSVVLNRAPEISITHPRDGTMTRDASTDVEGVVDDPAAFVDVNGVSARVDSGGRFLAPGVPLDTGENRLEARAVDAFGAAGGDAVRVTREAGAAGRLRVVMIDRRRPFVLDPFGAPATAVVGEDLESFRASLARVDLPPAAFDTPVESPAAGEQITVYVFSELGAPGEAVTLQVPEADRAFFEALRPLGELEADLAERSFAPELAAEILPRDFDPSSFASFELELFDQVIPQ